MQTQSSVSVNAENSARPVRVPVASHLPISRETFNSRSEALRDSLVASARRQCGQDADDVVQLTLVAAYQAWQQNRYHDPTLLQGPTAFAAWLYKILRDCIADYLRAESRRSKREGFSLDAPSHLEGSSDEADWRWSAFAADNERDLLRDTELLHEARQRARYADLTPAEAYCFQGRIEGKKLRQMQAATGMSKSAISRHITAAVAKARAVPLGLLSAPDADRYTWAIANAVTLYRAPITTGAALAREKHQLSEAGFQRAYR